MYTANTFFSVKSTFFTAIAASILLLSGCEANSPEDDTAMLMLDLEPVVGPQAFSESTTYTLNGQAMTFASGRFYLSEIVLIQEDGTEVTMTGESVTGPALNDAEETVTHTTNDRIILAKHDAGETLYEIGEVPAGAYKGVRMRIGLSGLTNKMDPTQVPSDHPLAQQTDRNNHWSWNAGYIFARMDGQLDLDGDGTVEQTEDALWDVHLGTPNFSQILEFDQTFSLAGGLMQNLHVVVDYAKLLETLDFSDPDERNCHTMDNMPVAMKVAAQYTSAFELHGIHSAE